MGEHFEINIPDEECKVMKLGIEWKYIYGNIHFKQGMENKQGWPLVKRLLVNYSDKLTQIPS